MNIAIEISGEGREAIDRLKEKMEDRAGLHAVIAMGAEAAMKNHLVRHYVPRSKRTGFWGKAAASVESTSNDNEAVVSIPHRGVRLRWLGGKVEPGKTVSSKTGRPTAALAVAVDDAVAGKLPGEAGPLAFIPSKRANAVGVLVRGEPKTITRGKNKGGTRFIPRAGAPVLFALVRSTTHKPDPGVIPEEDLANEAATAARMFLDG